MSLTVGGWILFIIFAFLFIAGSVAIGTLVSDAGKNRSTLVLCVVCGIFLSVFLLIGLNWYYSSTESGKRAVKTQRSDFHGGIKRRVECYDATGDLIKSYEGTFDVDYDDDRIIFDDERGFRHVIYYPTGTIIIDEVE